MSPSKEEQKPGEMRKAVISSTIWTFVGYGMGQVARLAGNLLLARVLFPEAFALMAIVTAIMIGLVMLSDIGLAPSIVQNKRGDERDFLDTAWTLQIIRATLLAAIAAALAWPTAAFYAANDPKAWELRGLITLMAVTMLIDGFQSTKLHTAVRHLNVKRVAILQLSVQLFSVVVMVGLAWWTRSVYALVISSGIGALLTCVLSHVLLPGTNNRLRWEPTAVQEIFHFGKWVFISTVVSFWAGQIDKFAFARLFLLADVGVYGIAASLALLAPTLMAKLQAGVMFPMYSRMRETNSSLVDVVQYAKPPILTLSGYMVALLIACTASFVAVAYDTRYTTVGIYVPILAAGAWFGMMEAMYGSAFLAIGKSNWVALANGIKLITFCLLLWPAAYWWGLMGAVIAFAATDLLKVVVAFMFARKVGMRSHKTELWHTFYCFGVGLGVLGFPHAISSVISGPPLITLVVQALLVTLAYALPLWRVARIVLRRQL